MRAALPIKEELPDFLAGLDAAAEDVDLDRSSRSNSFQSVANNVTDVRGGVDHQGTSGTSGVEDQRITNSATNCRQ